MHLTFATTRALPARRWLPTVFPGAAAALLIGAGDFSAGADGMPPGAQVRQGGFAELTMWFFGTPGDLGIKGPNPANGREGLKTYDPDAFNLLDDFYSGRMEPAENQAALRPPETKPLIEQRKAPTP